MACSIGYLRVSYYLYIAGDGAGAGGEAGTGVCVIHPGVLCGG